MAITFSKQMRKDGAIRFGLTWDQATFLEDHLWEMYVFGPKVREFDNHLLWFIDLDLYPESGPSIRKDPLQEVLQYMAYYKDKAMDLCNQLIEKAPLGFDKMDIPYAFGGGGNEPRLRVAIPNSIAVARQTPKLLGLFRDDIFALPELIEAGRLIRQAATLEE